MKVYIIIKRTSEDYHGSSDEILDVVDGSFKARLKVSELEEENYNCNIEYFFSEYTVN